MVLKIDVPVLCFTWHLAGVAPSGSEGTDEEGKKLPPASVAAGSGDVVTELTSTVCGSGSQRSFSSLSDVVSGKTLKAIEEMGFTDMMEIQYRSIRPLLEGR